MTSRALDDYLLPLVWQPAWRQAWLESEGSYTGLLSDIARIEAFIEQAGPNYLPDLLHCCLCRASIRSSTGRIPAKLIGQLVAANLWSSTRALRTISLLVDAHNQIEALVTIASLAGKASERLLERALDIACSEPELRERAAGLALVIPALGGMPALLERTLREIGALYGSGHENGLLAACVPSLIGNDELLSKALEQQRQGDSRYDRFKAMQRLADEMKTRPQLYPFALTQASAEEEDETRLTILIAAASQVSADAALVTPILDLIEAFDGKQHYCQVLEALAPVLRRLPEQLDRTLDHIAALDERWRCWALQRLLAALSAASLQRHASQLFDGLQGRGDWIALLTELLPVIRDEAAAPALMRQAIVALPDPLLRAQALLIAGSDLDGLASSQTLDAALRMLLAIPDEARRCRALKNVLAYGRPRACLELPVVEALEQLHDETLQGDTLAMVIRQCGLADPLLLRCAELARGLEDGLQRDLVAEMLVGRMYGWAHLREQADRIAEWIDDGVGRMRTALIRVSLHDSGRTSILREELSRLRHVEPREQRINLANMLIPAVAQYGAVRAHWIDALGPPDQDEVLLAWIRLAEACESAPGADLFNRVIDCATREGYPGTPRSVLTELARAASAHQDILLRVLDCWTDPPVYCNAARHAHNYPAVFEHLLAIAGALQAPADELLVNLAEASGEDSALLAKVLASRARLDDPAHAGRIALLAGHDRPNLRRLLEMAQSIGDNAERDAARTALVRHATRSASAAAHTLAGLDRQMPLHSRSALQALLAPALDAQTRRMLLLEMLAESPRDGTWSDLVPLRTTLLATPIDRSVFEQIAAFCTAHESARPAGALMAACNAAVPAHLLDDAFASTVRLADSTARAIGLTGLIERNPASTELVRQVAAMVPSFDTGGRGTIARSLAKAAGERTVELPVDALFDLAPLVDEARRTEVLDRIAPLLGADALAWRRYARLAVSLPRDSARDALLKHYLASWFDEPGLLRPLVRYVGLLCSRHSDAWDIVAPVLDAAIARHPDEAVLKSWALALSRLQNHPIGREIFRRAVYRLPEVLDAALSLAQRYLPDGVEPRLWKLFEARIRTELPDQCDDVMDRLWDSLPIARQIRSTVSLRAAVTVFLWRFAAPVGERAAYERVLRLLNPADRGTAQRMHRLDPPVDAVIDYWLAAARNNTGALRERYLRRAIDATATCASYRSNWTRWEAVAGLTMRPDRLMLYAFSQRSAFFRYGDSAKSNFLIWMSSKITPLPVLMGLLAAHRRADPSDWIFSWGVANQLELERFGFLRSFVPREIPAVPMADGIQCAERLLEPPDQRLYDHARDTIVSVAVENLPPGHPSARFLAGRAENIDDHRLRYIALLRVLRRPEAECRAAALSAALELAALELAPMPYTDALKDMLSVTGADPEALRQICTSLSAATTHQLQTERRLQLALAEAIEAVPQPSVRAEICQRLIQAMRHHPRPLVLNFLIPAVAGPLASLGHDDAMARALKSIACTAAWWP